MILTKNISLAEQFRGSNTVFLSLEHVGQFFGLSSQELAARVHVVPNTPEVQPHNSRIQSYLQDVMRVLSAVTELTGDARRAAHLICTEPIGVFDFKTADWLVSEGRTDNVVAYLESFVGGGTGRRSG